MAEVIGSDLSETVAHEAARREDDPAYLTPGTLIGGGRYRIASLLGRGGMGEVYRADDLQLGQTVALKFLTLGPDHAEIFIDELRIGRRLAHPNICRIYDVGGLSGRMFLTLQFVDGEDLATLLRRIGRLPVEKAVSVVRDLCSGLAAAHSAGIIHRDLKPSNVMIDGRGRALITDFGLAIAHDAKPRRPRAGTPAYMAPEQLCGEPATARSDLYALGMILYEVFTGIRAERSRKMLRPSDLVPDIDPAVERVILRCLEPNPSARPASVQAIIEALPAYDPLAAAVAAGETPSPGVVAAAVVKGDISPRRASLLLALAATAIGASMILAARSTPPLKSPDLLADRAKEILSVAGVSLAGADTASNYFRGENELFDPVPRRVDRDARSAVTYVYRSSPQSLRPHRRIVTASDPPLDAAGMTLVRLDPQGRLLDLMVVPRQTREPYNGQPDWERIVAYTGFDYENLTRTEPRWFAPMDADEHRAWIVAGAHRRIEVASRGDRVVWLSVIAPWQESAAVESTGRLDVLGAAMSMFLIASLAVCAAFLALQNVRRGQGDRAGAWRVTAMYMLAYVGAWMIAAYHGRGAIGEWITTRMTIGSGLFGAAIVFVIYLAAEPYARRRWPQMLISWTRLLSGRWRDPIIGRDVLIGGTAAALLLFAGRAPSISPSRFGIDTVPLLTDALPLGSVRYTLFWLAFPICAALLRGVGIVALLLLLRAVGGRVAVPATAWITALTAVDYFIGPVALRLALALACGTISVLLLVRFGMLAVMAFSYVADVVANMPFSFSPSSWYFDQSVFAAAVLATLFIGAFHVSLNGKRWLPRLSIG